MLNVVPDTVFEVQAVAFCNLYCTLYLDAPVDDHVTVTEVVDEGVTVRGCGMLLQLLVHPEVLKYAVLL